MSTRQARFIGVLGLVVIVAIAVWATLASGPKEFRGTLHDHIAGIGGETTGVILVTTDRTYDLDLRLDPRWKADLPSLDGKVVVVRGEVTVIHGIEVRGRRVINVQELRLDAPASQPAP